MIECPRCHSDLPDDSDFCMYCGKSITDTSIVESPDVEGSQLKENPNKNGVGILSLLVMVGTLVVFDFGLGGLVQSMGRDYRWVYVVSTVFYLAAIALAVLSLYIDHREKLQGYKPGQNQGFAAATIAFSTLIILLNLNQIVFA